MASETCGLKLLQKLQTQGADKDAYSALQALTERGFKGADKDSENTYLDEMQFALLTTTQKRLVRLRRTGAIQCSIRGIAEALQVDDSALGKLLKKLQTEGAVKEGHLTLQELARRRFKGAVKDSENTYVDEMQFALLVDYYAEASRKKETREYCKLLRTAFVAVGAR